MYVCVVCVCRSHIGVLLKHLPPYYFLTFITIIIVVCVYVAYVWASNICNHYCVCVPGRCVAYLHSSHVEAGEQLYEVGSLLFVDPRVQTQALRPALQAPLPSESSY